MWYDGVPQHMCRGVRQTRTPHPTFSSTTRPRAHPDQAWGGSLGRVKPLFLVEKVSGVFRDCCSVGLVLKAASARAVIGTPMEPSHLWKTCCVTPHGHPNQPMGLVPQQSFCFLPGSCQDVGLNGDVYCSQGQRWTPWGLWCWDIPTLWVEYKELIKFNPSEAEIMGWISSGVNQHVSAGVNGTNPACPSTGSGLVPAIVHSHKHCWVPWN